MHAISCRYALYSQITPERNVTAASFSPGPCVCCAVDGLFWESRNSCRDIRRNSLWSTVVIEKLLKVSEGFTNWIGNEWIYYNMTNKFPCGSQGLSWRIVTTRNLIRNRKDHVIRLSTKLSSIKIAPCRLEHRWMESNKDTCRIQPSRSWGQMIHDNINI